MKNTALIAASVLLLGSVFGCSSTNRVVGHSLTQTGHWYGELGITGHLNNITVQSGSTLNLLSIIGDGNKVDIADGCTLGKIELWGEYNIVTIPGHIVLRVAEVGRGNKIIRRGVDLEAKPVVPEEPFEQIEKPVGTPTGQPKPTPLSYPVEPAPAGEPE
jgi:hypothetical protein